MVILIWFDHQLPRECSTRQMPLPLLFSLPKFLGCSSTLQLAPSNSRWEAEKSVPLSSFQFRRLRRVRKKRKTWLKSRKKKVYNNWKLYAWKTLSIRKLSKASWIESFFLHRNLKSAKELRHLILAFSAFVKSSFLSRFHTKPKTFPFHLSNSIKAKTLSR